MKITIPFKTPTINHLYWHKGNIKIMKTEARKLKQKIRDICFDTIKEKMYFIDCQKLKVTTEIYENWMCKNGSVKKVDISNREKFLIDAVFDAIDWDDKFIFEHKMIKVQSAEEKAVITIELLEA